MAKIYTIEARAYDIADVAAHDFWVLRDENNNVLAQLHGLATTPTGEIIPVGTIGDELKFYHFGSYAISLGLDPLQNRNYIDPNQDSRLVFSGTEAEVMARWNTAVNAIPTLNNLNLDYSPFGFIDSTVVNSNAAYTVFGKLMDVPVYDFSGYWEPGFGNDAEILTPATLESLRYHPVISGVPTSQFNININPNIITPKLTTPTDPLRPINSTNNTLLSSGNYSLTGVGDVNVAKGIEAWFNNSLTDIFRPGAFQLAPISPTQTLSQMIDDAFSLPALVNGFNNATRGLNLYTPTDPLLLDLNGDGVHMTDYGSNPVLFDIDHDGGTLEQTGWVSAQDGIVVYDRDINGKIDDISETLSEYFNGSVGSGGNAGTKPHSNGLAALKSLDSNNDNQFTSADAAWNNVKVWVDDNHDGKSWKDTDNDGVLDAGEVSELKTLASLGITSINLAGTFQSGLVRDGNEVLASSTFVQNGATKEAIAANFIADPSGSSFTASGTGTLTQTEGNVKSYTAGNGGETIDVAAKAVNNAMGGNGNDTLIGDATNNWLAGGLGADSFNAGAGDDVLLIDAGDTQIDGGDGNDLVQVIGDAGVTLNLAQSHVEGVQGGRGDDFLYGGGNGSVFIRGGDGDDVLIGGAANDALNGENGSDLVDGGAGNDILRGGRGEDRLTGGAGDDLIFGGLDDDKLSGNAGTDILSGDQGDDEIDGGDGIDLAQFSGKFSDYRISLLPNGIRVSDTVSGRDGSDVLKNIEGLSFADIRAVNIDQLNVSPVSDRIKVNATGQALSRSGVQVIGKAQILANDLNLRPINTNGTANPLHISAVTDVQGGSATINANGDVEFTSSVGYTGVMGFSYTVADSLGHTGLGIIDPANPQAGATQEIKGRVSLITPDLPSDQLLDQQRYLSDSNVFGAWGTASAPGYSGKGVRIAMFEPEGLYGTGPEVFDYRHADLQANADKAWLNALDAVGNSTVPQAFSAHATLVAGVMVAAKNGDGSVGVAYGATLAGFSMPRGEGLTPSQLTAQVAQSNSRFKDYDVVNNSWGASVPFPYVVTPLGSMESGIGQAISLGRNGLGTAVVFSAGNDRQVGGNTNTDPLKANWGVITVGGINPAQNLGNLQPSPTRLSNPGANILVSAAGAYVTSTGETLTNDNGSVFGQAYESGNGTSFAAPIVSGVIALMLEANPKLGYRDIQTILALRRHQG